MPSPRVSREGLLQIIAHEAIVLTRYRDVVGVWTLGIGHTAAAGPPDPEHFPGALTLGEALRLFRRDLGRYEREVNAAVSVPLARHEFDALVSFHFNTGGIARAELTRSLNAGDRAAAAAQFLNWSKPAAIIPRRLAEQALFATGHYDAARPVRLYRADAEGRLDVTAVDTVDLTGLL